MTMVVLLMVAPAIIYQRYTLYLLQYISKRTRSLLRIALVLHVDPFAAPCTRRQTHSGCRGLRCCSTPARPELFAQCRYHTLVLRLVRQAFVAKFSAQIVSQHRIACGENITEGGSMQGCLSVCHNLENAERQEHSSRSNRTTHFSFS